MNIIFRVLLAVYAFFLTIISLVLMVITVKPQIFEDVFRDFLFSISNASPSYAVMLFIIELIFFVLSVIFLFSGLKSNKDRKSMTKVTNLGEVKISLSSLESIALLASKRTNYVKESKAYVYKRDDGVLVIIKMVVLHEANIPAISEEIQGKVKKAIEETSGVSVYEVKIQVENVYAGYKSRVE